MATQEVLASIPQREPFLFVDEVVSRQENSIICKKHLTGEEDFFKGHFPGNPIMPGVLLQEAVFQTGALLMNKLDTQAEGLGVVTRVEKAKFKKFAAPGDTLEMEVTLKETISNAYYMSGKIRVSNKIIMTIDFACALV